nr:hypothetical protein [Neorhizobium tomejilense]
MTHYSWTISTEQTSVQGEGDHLALTAAVALSDPPGVAPADWIVDLLLADGFTDGVTTHENEGDKGWSLEVREIVASAA